MSRVDAMRRPADLSEYEAIVWDQVAPLLVRMGTLTSETRDLLAQYVRAAAARVVAVKDDDDEAFVEACETCRVISRRLGLTPFDRLGLARSGEIDWKFAPPAYLFDLGEVE